MINLNFVKNKVSRDIPVYIEGIGNLRPYGLDKEGNNIDSKRLHKESKVLESIREALVKADIKDGMTISFHHHLRNGDYVLNMVLDEIAAYGVRDLTVCASSLTDAHEGVLEHIKNGVVTGIQTSGLRGTLGRAISEDGILKKPVIFRSHGGRARAIEEGNVKIDIAFIGAPCCDEAGNMNGQKGKSAFGSMGYAMMDAKYAKKVVAITDNLVEYPACPVSIPENLVDYVVVVESLGDIEKIGAGATRLTKNPTELLIAENAAKVIIESGYVKNGFSFQAGSGGAALAVAKYLRDYMRENNIKGSFGSGGITSFMVDMLEEGLFSYLLDVQTFDAQAAASYLKNDNHIEMSASMYANTAGKGCVADKLDIMILSATEIDTDFNVNVLTASTGVFMGAIGGHQDTAEGAKLTVAVAPLLRKRIPIVVDKVTTIVTPGENIDIVVTERGVAVNPRNKELAEALKGKGLPLVTIEELKNTAEKLTGKPDPAHFGDKIIGIVESGDGSIIDVVYNVIKD